MSNVARPVGPAATVANGAPSDRIWTADFLKISLANMASFGSFYVLLATLPLYVLAVGGSESDVGLVLGVFSVGSVLARPFLGAALDKFGRKSILATAMLGMAVSSFSYMFALSVMTLILVRSLHGVAFAGTTTTSAAYVGDIVPPRRRAEGIGHYQMLANASLAVGPWISLQIVGLAGFPTMFAVSAAIAAAGAIVALTLRELPRPAEPMTAERWIDRLINPKAIRPALILFLFASTYSAQVVFLPVYAVERNLGDVGLYFAVYAIALMASRAFSGKIADRFGRGAAIVPGMALAAASMISLSLATDMVLLMVTALMYSLAFALVTPALSALVVDVTTTQTRGSAMATYTAAMDVGIGAGAFLWGFVIQQVGFTVMYQLAAVVAVIGIVAYFVFVYGKMEPVESLSGGGPPADGSG